MEINNNSAAIVHVIEEASDPLPRHFTLRQWAERLGADKATLYGFLRFLEAHGALSNVGRVPSNGKRGKGESLYQLHREKFDHLMKTINFSLQFIEEF